MDTPFDKKNQEELKVCLNGKEYRGDEIIAYYEDIIIDLGKEPPSLNNRNQFINTVKILLKKREYRKAMGAVYQSLSNYPGDSEIIQLLVEAFFLQKNPEEALKVIEKYLEEYPGSLTFKLLRARAFKIMNESISEEMVLIDVINSPGFDFISNRLKTIALRRIAEIYIKSKRYEQAEQIVKTLLQRSKDESCWSMLFTVLMNLGKREELAKAKEDFAAYKRSKIYFERGDFYEAQHKLDLAYSTLKKGLEIYKDDAHINIRTANILMRRKKWYSKAEEHFKKAVQLDPQQENYIAGLALCLKKQGKYKEAFDTAKKAVLMDPENNLTIFLSIARKANKTIDFVNIIEECINNDKIGLFPSLRLEIGHFYEEKDDMENALQWYKQALVLYQKKLRSNFGNCDVYLQIGNCYNLLRQYEKAESFYKKAEEVCTANPNEIYHQLIELYQKTGKPLKASVYIKKLIRRNPKNLTNYIDLSLNMFTRAAASLKQRDSLQNDE